MTLFSCGGFGNEPNYGFVRPIEYITHYVHMIKMNHTDVGWDTVAAGAAIVFVTSIHSSRYMSPLIPPTYTALLLGAICALFMKPGFGFGPEIFFYAMLPPIILRSGLEFDSNSITTTWRTTALYSIVGTILSALIIFLGCFVNTTLGFTKCSHIGAVLSSTDPVATVSSMKYSSFPLEVRNVLENEALTNDAMAAMMTHATEKQMWSTSNTVLDVIIGILTSLSAGAVGGFACGGFKTPIAVLGSAVTLFALCEVLNASGILCIFVFAITSKWRTQNDKLKTFVDIVADLADIYCMFAVGTEVIYIDLRAVEVAMYVFLSCVASRILFTTMLGVLSMEGWTMDELMVMGFSGARGTLSYALARSASSGIGPVVLCVVLMSAITNTITSFIVTNI